MAGLYFEDFEIGKEYVHPWSRTVTETDTILYCGLTMNPAPIHLDAHYMETTIHGQRLVPSLYTGGLVGGMIVNELTLGTTLGNLGYTKFDFPKPVFHGDTIRAEPVCSMYSLRTSLLASARCIGTNCRCASRINATKKRPASR